MTKYWWLLIPSDGTKPRVLQATSYQSKPDRQVVVRAGDVLQKIAVKYASHIEPPREITMPEIEVQI